MYKLQWNLHGLCVVFAGGSSLIVTQRDDPNHALSARLNNGGQDNIFIRNHSALI